MPRRDIEDEVCIRVPVPGGDGELERRWWAISQPPPSVAFALQASIADALGGAADQAIRLLLRAVDPETEEEVEAAEKTLGESVALAVFRNARAGRALVPEVVELVDGTSRDAHLGDATDRLRAVLAFVGGNLGVRLSAARLVGVPERDRDNLAFRWKEPALLHQLLMYSPTLTRESAMMPTASAGIGRRFADGSGSPKWATRSLAFWTARMISYAGKSAALPGSCMRVIDAAQRLASPAQPGSASSCSPGTRQT